MICACTADNWSRITPLAAAAALIFSSSPSWSMDVATMSLPQRLVGNAVGLAIRVELLAAPDAQSRAFNEPRG